MVQLEAEGKWVEREWGQHAAKAHMVELNLDHCSKDLASVWGVISTRYQTFKW